MTQNLDLLADLNAIYSQHSTGAYFFWPHCIIATGF